MATTIVTPDELVKLEEILIRNITEPPVEAPCRAKIDELQRNIQSNSTSDGMHWGNIGALEREHVKLIILCNILNLSPSVREEELHFIVKMNSLIRNELQLIESKQKVASRDRYQRLKNAVSSLEYQLPYYTEAFEFTPAKIPALWGSPKLLENRIRNLGLPSVPMRSSNTPKTLENRMRNLGLPSVLMRNTPNFPSPYKGPIRPPFKKGGKQTKKVRKHRRRRTSRS